MKPDPLKRRSGAGSIDTEPRAPNPETRDGMKRREVLKVLGAAPAAALLPGAAAQRISSEPQSVKPTAPTKAEVATAYKRKILTEHEYNTVRILSDWIVPADERSGSATQAGVPEFIDDWLDFRRGQVLDAIRGGITWLDLECNRQYGHDFLGCAQAQQKQILDRIAYPKRAAPDDLAGVAFFNEMRNVVLSGFFSSKMGVKDLPYLGNQMLASWDGCPPEVLEKLGLR